MEVYYIWIIADNVSSGAIAQTSTVDDFQHSVAFTVAQPVQLPNLVPQSITLNKSSVLPGDTLTINWSLANTGSGSSPSTVTGVRMNQSSTSYSGTTIVNVSMPALAANSSTPQNTTITVPAGTAAGTYHHHPRRHGSGHLSGQIAKGRHTRLPSPQPANDSHSDRHLHRHRHRPHTSSRM